LQLSLVIIIKFEANIRAQMETTNKEGKMDDAARAEHGFQVCKYSEAI